MTDRTVTTQTGDILSFQTEVNLFIQMAKSTLDNYEPTEYKGTDLQSNDIFHFTTKELHTIERLRRQLTKLQTAYEQSSERLIVDVLLETNLAFCRVDELGIIYEVEENLTPQSSKIIDNFGYYFQPQNLTPKHISPASDLLNHLEAAEAIAKFLKDANISYEEHYDALVSAQMILSKLRDLKPTYQPPTPPNEPEQTR